MDRIRIPAVLALTSAFLGSLFSQAFAAAPAASREAEVSEVVREVDLLRPRQSAAPAKVGDTIAGSTAVRTGVQSRAQLSFVDQTLLRLGSNTQFSFLSGKHEFDLSSGTALLRTSKSTGGARIHSGGITAAITGSLAIFHTPPSLTPGIAKLLLFYGKASMNVCGKEYKLKPWQMVMVYVDGSGQPDCDSVRVFYFDAETTARTSKLIDPNDQSILAEILKGKKDFLRKYVPPLQLGNAPENFPDLQQDRTEARILDFRPPPEPVPQQPEKPSIMDRIMKVMTPSVPPQSNPPPGQVCPPGEFFDEDFQECFPGCPNGQIFDHLLQDCVNPPDPEGQGDR